MIPDIAGDILGLYMGLGGVTVGWATAGGGFVSRGRCVNPLMGSYIAVDRGVEDCGSGTGTFGL